MIGGACAPGGSPEVATLQPPTRVFLIVVDTLRADHLGTYGYPRSTSPFVDSIAAEGVVFERAIAQWPKTGASMASMFTGRYPQSTGLTHNAAVDLPPVYDTIPEMFRGEGYRTVAVIGNAVLAAELGWSDGFDEFVEPWKLVETPPEGPFEWRRLLNADSINRHALDLLETHADDERLFFWLHYMDPHSPYVLPDGVENPFLGDEHFVGETEIGDWFPEPEIIDGRRDLDFYVAQYDANVLVVDRAIRAFLERAEELGLMENALVVITSDHGEGLGEHQELRHGRLPYNSTSRVPLVVWDPERIEGGRRIERPVELVDLYPTLRDLIAPGAEVGGLEGDSFVHLLESSRDGATDAFDYAFSEAGDGNTPWIHYRSIQSSDWKLVYHPDRSDFGKAAVWELYDLESDPDETTNVVRDKRQQANRLRSELFDWMVDPDQLLQVRGEAEEQSEDVVKALKALGYLN